MIQLDCITCTRETGGEPKTQWDYHIRLKVYYTNSLNTTSSFKFVTFSLWIPLFICLSKSMYISSNMIRRDLQILDTPTISRSLKCETPNIKLHSNSPIKSRQDMILLLGLNKNQKTLDNYHIQLRATKKYLKYHTFAKNIKTFFIQIISIIYS